MPFALSSTFQNGDGAGKRENLGGSSKYVLFGFKLLLLLFQLLQKYHANVSPGVGAMVAFCGKILLLGRGDLFMSLCKCPH